MNAQGLQQGQYRGVWFEEDVQLLDLYVGSSQRGARRLLLTVTLTTIDIIGRNMREVIDANWSRIQRARLGDLPKPVDGIPWEIHDIDDPAAREVATMAYFGNRVD